MFSSVFRPAPFLRAVAGTDPFRAYCELRQIRFGTRPADAPDTASDRWGAAVAALPPDVQAHIELELAQAYELSGPDATAHLLEAAGGGNLPADDVPAGAPLALWFLVHRPTLFQDVFFRHEVAEIETWRTARAAAGIAIENVPARVEALGAEVRDFFRQTSGIGRYCAVEAHRLPDAECFAVRVADRIQLIDGFADDGRTCLQRVRPALSVLFAYAPGDGTLRLKSPLRAVDRVRDLFQRFGQVVLGDPVMRFGEVFDLDKLKRPVLLLPDAEDMEEVRVKTLHLRYPSRLGRRGLRLETPPGDAPGAIEDLLRSHVGETAGELAVWRAEIEVRIRSGGRPRSHLIRLWPDRCNLNQTPLGDRLRRCLDRWGLRYA